MSGDVTDEFAIGVADGLPMATDLLLQWLIYRQISREPNIDRARDKLLLQMLALVDALNYGNDVDPGRIRGLRHGCEQKLRMLVDPARARMFREQ